MIISGKHYCENQEDIIDKKQATHRRWQPRLLYKKEKNKLPNKKKRYGFSQKKFEIFVFPHHSINNKNVRSIERDGKPRPNENSRKSNRDRKEGVGSKTYRP